MPIVVKMTSATSVNLSLLTADLFGLFCGLFLFQYTVSTHTYSTHTHTAHTHTHTYSTHTAHIHTIHRHAHKHTGRHSTGIDCLSEWVKTQRN